MYMCFICAWNCLQHSVWFLSTFSEGTVSPAIYLYFNFSLHFLTFGFPSSFFYTFPALSLSNKWKNVFIRVLIYPAWGCSRGWLVWVHSCNGSPCIAACGVDSLGQLINYCIVTCVGPLLPRLTHRHSKPTLGEKIRPELRVANGVRDLSKTRRPLGVIQRQRPSQYVNEVMG